MTMQSKKIQQQISYDEDDQEEPREARDVLNVLSVSELQAMDFTNIEWRVQDTIPAVGVTFLTGRPKRGKSWLGLQLSGAAGTGGTFLGRKVRKGRVLYLAMEDNDRRMKNRTEKQGWKSDNVSIVSLTRGKMKKLESGGLEQLRNTIEDGDYDVVIIDTLKKITRLDPSKDEISKVLEPLHALAHELSIAIIIIHHTRKPNGHESDVVDDVMGNTSIAGAADTIMGLYRDTNKQEAVLKITGRDVVEGELNLLFDTFYCTWQITEGPSLPDKGARGRVISAIKSLMAEGRTTRNADIANRAGMTPGNCSTLLREMMVDDGLLTKNVYTSNYEIAEL